MTPAQFISGDLASCPCIMFRIRATRYTFVFNDGANRYQTKQNAAAYRQGADRYQSTKPVAVLSHFSCFQLSLCPKGDLCRAIGVPKTYKDNDGARRLAMWGKSGPGALITQTSLRSRPLCGGEAHRTKEFPLGSKLLIC